MLLGGLNSLIFCCGTLIKASRYFKSSSCIKASYRVVLCGTHTFMHRRHLKVLPIIPCNQPLQIPRLPFPPVPSHSTRDYEDQYTWKQYIFTDVSMIFIVELRLCTFKLHYTFNVDKAVNFSRKESQLDSKPYSVAYSVAYPGFARGGVLE